MKAVLLLWRSIDDISIIIIINWWRNDDSNVILLLLTIRKWYDIGIINVKWLMNEEIMWNEIMIMILLSQ